uniref:THAP-type domain-containing protein n=1 Tax=Lepeophtheirus salmonis TaxID=72036 RepID=A0A0K2V9L2_LEPSM
MPDRCIAPGCKTGHLGNEKTENISTHKFPSNVKEREKWIEAIEKVRANWTYPTNTKKPPILCSLHFYESSFITVSKDVNDYRKKNRESKVLQRRRLKKGSVPVMFPDLPSHMSKLKVCHRESKCLTENRHKANGLRLLKEAQARIEADTFYSLQDLYEKFRNDTTTNFEMLLRKSGNELLFIHIDDGDGTIGHQIVCSVVFDQELEFKMFVQGSLVPSSRVSNLFNGKKCSRISELKKLLKALILIEREEPRFTPKTEVTSTEEEIFICI